MIQLNEKEIYKRLGELEAKCYAYEQIIANSNFKPILPPDSKLVMEEVEG